MKIDANVTIMTVTYCAMKVIISGYAAQRMRYGVVFLGGHDCTLTYIVLNM